MNREIKFRAWDDFNKEMIDYLHIDKQGWIFSHKTNSPFVMQFTGLLDRNGKEIYEGDILRDDNGIGVAVWDKSGAWGYQIWNEHYTYPDTAFTECLLSDMAPSFCEVIGNIYENPELAEGIK